MIALRSTRLLDLVRSHAHIKDIRSRHGIAAGHRSEVHVIEDALIQSSCGITGLLSTGDVVEDTLDHTEPARDGYVRKLGTLPGESDQIVVSAPSRHVAGKVVSLLLGNYQNHFHWLLMNIGRLALLTSHDLMNAHGILVPADLSAPQRELIDLLGVRNFAPLVPVSRGEGLRVGRLVLAWNAVSPSGLSIDPAVVAFYRRLAAMKQRAVGGKSIYVDRRSSPVRPLTNEGEIVDMLRFRDIAPVRFNGMSLVDQIDVMRSARTIVAPHGAGLANMVFADPGARVVELMPSGAVNWCYRSLAAACGHSYQSVMGDSIPTRHVAPLWQPWHVSPADVLNVIGGAPEPR